MGVEFGCTFLLVMTVMAATDSVRAKTNAHIPIIAPLVVGLAVTVAHFVAIPVDNCSINPARSWGVSVISGNFSDWAVFWFGPYLGATAAALVYQYLLTPDDEGGAAKGKAGAVELVDDAPAPAPAPAAPEAVSVPAPAGTSEWK